MAIVWQKQVSNTHYEVRTAGNSRRLYTNGIFHSQYNPSHILTSGVWDLLMLPAFFIGKEQLQRILVLGVGGGAVIHQLFNYIEPGQVIGVDMDPVHLDIAKRFFDLRYRRLTLHQAEARQWLSQYRGDKFDLIIEDLFIEQDGEPERAMAIDNRWMSLLCQHLSAKGTLVMNCVALQEIKRAMGLLGGSAGSPFQSAYRLDSIKHSNIIAAFFRTKVTQLDLKRHLRTHPDLDDRKPTCRLAFSAKSLGVF